MSRMLVAMSGGVDSSVAAALLQEQGHEGVGLFMRNGITASVDARPGKQGCCSLGDAQDARFVAGQLGVKFYVLNFAEDFKRVIDYFVAEYKRGRTPNPCAVCNTDLKFGKLLDYARMVSAEKVATGHYARTDYRDGRWRLYRGRDDAKDQSYYLFGLSQEQLGHAHFPLGELRKDEVRALAAKFGLRTRDKPESMEICFVPEGDYRKVVAEVEPAALQPGPIVDCSGQRLGEHGGVAGFTIGQRRGIGVAAAEAYYVVRLEPATNTVVVGAREELRIDRIRVSRLNWIAYEAPEAELRVIARIRSRHAGTPATVRRSGGDSVEVEFDEPVEGAAPGQCAVFYAQDGDEVLGGGWID